LWCEPIECIGGKGHERGLAGRVEGCGRRKRIRVVKKKRAKKEMDKEGRAWNSEP
jgi:hypothetical protein